MPVGTQTKTRKKAGQALVETKKRRRVKAADLAKARRERGLPGATKAKQVRKNVPSVRRNSKKKGEYVFKFSQPAKGVRRKTNRRQHVAAGRPYLLAGDRKKKPLIACADEDRRPAIGRTGALICSKPRPRRKAGDPKRAPNAWAIATGKAFKAGDLKSIKDLATPAGKAAVRKHMAKAKRAAAPKRAARSAAKRAAPKRAARSVAKAAPKKRAAPKRAARSVAKAAPKKRAAPKRAAAPRRSPRSTRLLGAVPM